MRKALAALVIIVMVHIALSDPPLTENSEKNIDVVNKYSLHGCSKCIADQTKKVWSDLHESSTTAYWWGDDLEDRLWANTHASCSSAGYYTGPATYILCPPDVNIWGVQNFVFNGDSADKIITYSNSNIKYKKDKTYLFKNEISTLSNGFEELMQKFKTYPCTYLLEADYPSIFGYDISILSINDAEVYVYTEYRHKQVIWEKTLINQGDSVSVNIAHIRNHGSYVHVIVVPKSTFSTALIKATARQKIYINQESSAKLIFANLMATTIISAIVLFLWLRRKKILPKIQNRHNEDETEAQSQKAI